MNINILVRRLMMNKMDWIYVSLVFSILIIYHSHFKKSLMIWRIKIHTGLEMFFGPTRPVGQVV